MAIQDQTIDRTVIELERTLKALKDLISTRNGPVVCYNRDCKKYRAPFENDLGQRCLCGHVLFPAFSEVKQHAAVKRASMDLSRILADLRQGR